MFLFTFLSLSPFTFISSCCSHVSIHLSFFRSFILFLLPVLLMFIFTFLSPSSSSWCSYVSIHFPFTFFFFLMLLCFYFLPFSDSFHLLLLPVVLMFITTFLSLVSFSSYCCCSRVSIPFPFTFFFFLLFSCLYSLSFLLFRLPVVLVFILTFLSLSSSS